MKKFLCSFIACFMIALFSFAQPSNKINYQTVVRDGTGKVSANQAVAFRLTIHNGSAGPVLYQERQTSTTNQFGLSTMKIGAGTVLAGNFDTITWSIADPYLQVELDPAGGTAYTNMGESQMLSVPSANYSNVSKSTLSIGGTTNYLSKFTSSNTLGNSLIKDDGNYITIGSPGASGRFAIMESTGLRAFYAGQTGTTGNAGRFDITNAANPADALYVTTVGTGPTATFVNTNTLNSANGIVSSVRGSGIAVQGSTDGTGSAGYFKITNAATQAHALRAESNSDVGSAVYGLSSGGGDAGHFLIFNAISPGNALFASTSGTGNAGYFYGNVVLASGKLGVGTIAPASLFSISAASPDARITWTNTANFGRILFYENSGIFGTIQQNGSTYNAGRANNIEIQNLTASGAVSLWTNGAERLRIISGGSVGIGTTAPDQLLSVNGNASKVGGGSWATFSDKRLKKDIVSFNDGLNVLNQIKPVRFKYNGLADYPDNGKEYIGVIAQEVQKAAPYMIETKSKKLNESDASETDLLMYDSSSLTYVLVNSVKELSQQVNALQSRIEKLEKENNELRTVSAKR